MATTTTDWNEYRVFVQGETNLTQLRYPHSQNEKKMISYLSTEDGNASHTEFNYWKVAEAGKILYFLRGNRITKETKMVALIPNNQIPQITVAKLNEEFEKHKKLSVVEDYIHNLNH